MLSRKFPENLTSAKIEFVIRKGSLDFFQRILRRFERLEKWEK
jgi:hypothetical protein